MIDSSSFAQFVTHCFCPNRIPNCWALWRPGLPRWRWSALRVKKRPWTIRLRKTKRLPPQVIRNNWLHKQLLVGLVSFSAGIKNQHKILIKFAKMKFLWRKFQISKENLCFMKVFGIKKNALPHYAELFNSVVTWYLKKREKTWNY